MNVSSDKDKPDKVNIPHSKTVKKVAKSELKQRKPVTGDTVQSGPASKKTIKSKNITKGEDLSNEEHAFNDDWTLEEAHAGFIQLLELLHQKHEIHEHLEAQLEKSKAYTNGLMDQNLENREELVILHGVRAKEIEKLDNYMNEQQHLRVEHNSNKLGYSMLAAENKDLKEEIRQLQLQQESGDMTLTNCEKDSNDTIKLPPIKESKNGRFSLSGVYNNIGKKMYSIKNKMKPDSTIGKDKKNQNKIGWFSRKVKKNKVLPFTEQ